MSCSFLNAFYSFYQLQALLASDDDTPRPKELVRLQEKFAARYEEELSNAKEKFDQEIAMLKAEYKRDLESMILKSRNNKADILSLDSGKVVLVKIMFSSVGYLFSEMNNM